MALISDFNSKSRLALGTVDVSNFAERGRRPRKAQAKALRATAHRDVCKSPLKSEREISKKRLRQTCYEKKGDSRWVFAGELITGSGEVIEGAADLSTSRAIKVKIWPSDSRVRGDRSALNRAGAKVSFR